MRPGAQEIVDRGPRDKTTLDPCHGAPHSTAPPRRPSPLREKGRLDLAPRRHLHGVDRARIGFAGNVVPDVSAVLIVAPGFGTEPARLIAQATGAPGCRRAAALPEGSDQLITRAPLRQTRRVGMQGQARRIGTPIIAEQGIGEDTVVVCDSACSDTGCIDVTAVHIRNSIDFIVAVEGLITPNNALLEYER